MEMAGITLAQAEEKLAAYLEAEEKLLAGGQSYTIAGRTLARADLAEVRKGILFWDDQVKLLSQVSEGRRVRGVTPY
jgi:hypothetical protein